MAPYIMLPSSLQVALKEWDAVCRALGEGRQCILLRKGGILEAIGGFEIEHRTFLLFPTFLHQNLAMLKSDAQAGFKQLSEEPAEITMSYGASVVDIVQLKERRQMDALDDQHIWTPPLVDMRYNYRPRNPLYLLTVRAFKLASPVTVRNTPEYAGCKSWVPLESAVSFDASWVMDDATFDARRRLILDRLG
jgi:hypothetical protein